MTRITRTVRRETADKQFSRREYRSVIVSLEPPGKLIGLRLKGERTTYYLPFGVAYCMAVRASSEARRDARKQKSRRP